MAGEAKEEERQQDNTGEQGGNDEEVFSDTRERVDEEELDETEREEEDPETPPGQGVQSSGTVLGVSPGQSVPPKGMQLRSKKILPGLAGPSERTTRLRSSKVLADKGIRVSGGGHSSHSGSEASEEDDGIRQVGNPSYDDYWLVPRKERENSRN